MVTVIMDFTFKDGDGGTWATTDKTAFMNGVKTECEKAWSDKFRITPRYCADDLASEARVVILIKTAEDMSFWQSHWTIKAPKLKSPLQNFVRDKSDEFVVTAPREIASVHSVESAVRCRFTVLGDRRLFC